MDQPTAEQLPLSAILITAQLAERGARLADFEGESRAMLALAKNLADNPQEFLQTLAEVAQHLCRSGSAGISIIEDEKVFRWHGLVGELANHRWGTTPRYFSPCGTVVDTGIVQLMHYPEKHFEYFAAVKPTIVEGLLVPFRVEGKVVGTVWVVTHDDSRQFDQEDERLINNLAAFAAAGYRTQQTHNALQASLKNKDEFLIILGHELRNPLFPMVSAQTMLADAELPHPAHRHAVEIIGRQLLQMQRLVNSLLDVSRIAEGKIAFVKKPLEIGPLVRNAVDALRALANRSHQKLNLLMWHEPLRIDADGDRISQILNNLLLNALKFTPTGGVITVCVKKRDECVAISVKDTGIGLAPENLQLIFSKFAQVDSARTLSKGGLGIGLALAKSLAELHDGHIEVNSEGLNQGSEFVVIIPLLAVKEMQSTEANTPQSSKAKSPVAPLRILVADDNEDSANSLSMLLRAYGHQVEVVYDGRQTLSRAEAFSPHLILHDIGLPGIDGYEVIETLRSNPLTRHAVMVAVTEHASDSDRARSKAAGFDAHMMKPVDFNELRTVLERISVYEGQERRIAQHDSMIAERRRTQFDRFTHAVN